MTVYIYIYIYIYGLYSWLTFHIIGMSVYVIHAYNTYSAGLSVPMTRISVIMYGCIIVLCCIQSAVTAVVGLDLVIGARRATTKTAMHSYMTVSRIIAGRGVRIVLRCPRYLYATDL